ncbi:MAG: glycosyltransferase family 4 protein [Reichenbachiella sp.]|uniref:glycosyltransferase family 4 protein n=1 Tax=Reichenbachiella sp. TaxID=2184521 RepID=UPI0032980948
MSRPKSILFLTPYPQDTAGSQRFRFEQYLTCLIEAGHVYDSQSFINEATWEILYAKGHFFRKMSGIFLGFLRRIWVLFNMRKYDFVFIHREVTPLGYPIIEWFIAKIWRKRIIYDFDDAIWMPNTSTENRLVSWLKFPNKVKWIIKWSYKISAGNLFLVDYAKQYNPAVCLNPTTIDTVDRHLPESKPKKMPAIGWTGTHSTLKYLELLRSVLEDLSQVCDFEFIVIADKAPEAPFPNQKFVSWNRETEIQDLNQIDIGVMPLEEDKWAEGKCGFKALQFMALEKPVLVSPVGVNKEIVEPEVSGFHCSKSEDWFNNLKLMIENKDLGSEMGKKGRDKVKQQYSVESNKQNFLSLFE